MHGIARGPRYRQEPVENIAHSLCGWRLSQLGFARDVGPRGWVVGVVAANFPDIDVIHYAFDEDRANWYHRGITHSFLGWPWLALAGAAASHRWLRTAQYRDHLALWSVGLLSHALMDWPTTWGTLLLWPLSSVRFGLEWIFIVDPAYWVALGLLPRLLRAWGSAAAARSGLLALGAWALFCAMMKEQASMQAPEPVRTFPAPLAPFQWTAVAADAAGTRRYFLTPWSAEAAGSFVSNTGTLVDCIKADPRGAKDQWMAGAPVITEIVPVAGGTRVVVSDLAYASWLSPGTFRFSRTYVVSDDCRVIERATGKWIDTGE